MELFINNPGFVHISASIFESLDNQSLCKSRLVCKNWLWFIDQRKFIWKRCLQIKIDQVKPWLETNQDWAKIIENIFDSGTVEDLKDFALIFSSVKLSSLHFGITPLHQAVFAGNLKTVTFLGQKIVKYIN